MHKVPPDAIGHLVAAWARASRDRVPCAEPRSPQNWGSRRRVTRDVFDAAWLRKTLPDHTRVGRRLSTAPFDRWGSHPGMQSRSLAMEGTYGETNYGVGSFSSLGTGARPTFGPPHQEGFVRNLRPASCRPVHESRNAPHSTTSNVCGECLSRSVRQEHDRGRQAALAGGHVPWNLVDVMEPGQMGTVPSHTEHERAATAEAVGPYKCRISTHARGRPGS